MTYIDQWGVSVTQEEYCLKYDAVLGARFTLIAYHILPIYKV